MSENKARIPLAEAQAHPAGAGGYRKGSVMKLGSLFSGVGGIDLAFQQAGFSISWQVEIDRQARSVLSRHWPDVPKFEDVRKVGKKQLSGVDVIAGGFPCQDLSIAGKRGGIKGDRSGLYFQMTRIIDELRPSFFVWENVPGLLSSFTPINRPPDNPVDGQRWDLAERSCFEAVLAEIYRIGFSGCWRSLDAQFFGVPQRRERVFGVFARGRAGAERCAEILSLTQSVRGNSEASGEAREGIAATLRGRSASRGVSVPGRGGEDDSNLVLAFDARQNAVLQYGEQAGTLDGNAWTNGVLAPTLPARTKAGGGQGTDFDCDGGLVIAHSLRAEGFDASEDGTGRGTPIIPIDMRQASRGEKMTNNRPNGSSGGAPGTGIGEDGDPSPTLSHSHTPAVGLLQGVRRLTPRECERLMGLPDDWTRYDVDGKEQKDGPRYKQIGNGVAVPCLEWIARRIKEATEQPT